MWAAAPQASEEAPGWQWVQEEAAHSWRVASSEAGVALPCHHAKAGAHPSLPAPVCPALRPS